jgi:Protein of unknown function (DUF3050)
LVTNAVQFSESLEHTIEPRGSEYSTPAHVASCSDKRLPESQRFEQLKTALASQRYALLSHPMYAEINSLGRLREFMQMHVFAVWDFMSLVKRLERDLTSNRLPWTPPQSAHLARFTNEVILGEETDLGLDGTPVSHFELYLRAMDEVGADTTPIRSFTAQLVLGAPWEELLEDFSLPSGVRDFVSETLGCALHGSIVEVAAAFFFGREDVIPEMFQRLLGLWGNAKAEVPHFAYYLERHIELDGGSHGPWAQEMLTTLAGRRQSNWQKAAIAAQRAIASRINLWDNVRASFSTPQGTRRLPSGMRNNNR